MSQFVLIVSRYNSRQLVALLGAKQTGPREVVVLAAPPNPFLEVVDRPLATVTVAPGHSGYRSFLS